MTRIEANIESGMIVAEISEVSDLMEKAYLLCEKEPLKHDIDSLESCRTRYERVNTLKKLKTRTGSAVKTKPTSARDIIKFPKASIPKFNGDILT